MPYRLFQKVPTYSYSLKFNKQYYSQEDWKKNSLKSNWITALPDCTSVLGREVKGTWLSELTNLPGAALYISAGD